jgi:hypothetical protein
MHLLRRASEETKAESLTGTGDPPSSATSPQGEHALAQSELTARPDRRRSCVKDQTCSVQQAASFLQMKGPPLRIIFTCAMMVRVR